MGCARLWPVKWTRYLKLTLELEALEAVNKWTITRRALKGFVNSRAESKIGNRKLSKS